MSLVVGSWQRTMGPSMVIPGRGISWTIPTLGSLLKTENQFQSFRKTHNPVVHSKKTFIASKHEVDATPTSLTQGLLGRGTTVPFNKKQSRQIVFPGPLRGSGF